MAQDKWRKAVIGCTSPLASFINNSKLNCSSNTGHIDKVLRAVIYTFLMNIATPKMAHQKAWNLVVSYPSSPHSLDTNS